MGAILILSACSSTAPNLSGASLFESVEAPTPPPADAEPPIRVALVMKTLTNPFFIEMERGARRAERELGIQLVVKTAAQETSIQEQVQIIDALILEKVDAIVIAPGDSVELIPPLKRAQDAGIVIINIDNRLDAGLSKKSGLKGVPYVGVDNEEGGYLSAMEIVRRLSGPNEAAILEGIPTSQNSVDRVAGAQRAFAENPQIDLVLIKSAHWKIDEGYEVTREILAQFPNIKALFCANDMMALGAVQYLQDAGMQGVLVAGYDNLDEVQDALKQGALVATIDQQAAEQGYLGVQYAVRALKNETLPAETLVDVQLVTADSLP